MGAGRWDAAASTTYNAYTRSTASSTREEVFAERKIKPELDPKGVHIRESRDSAENPRSTAIIVALDVTGSMGMLAETLARQGLGTLFTQLLDRRPVSDPHLMFMAIGDAHCDQAPLQVSQFEADARIIEQLAGIYLEGGGGGNDTESYNLPWYFATVHTSIDCFEKRGEKGYLFTVGDECAPSPLTAGQIKQFLGDNIQTANGLVDDAALLKAVQERYHVFHIIAKEGSYARGHFDRARQSWIDRLGQHVITLEDHTKLPELIVSLIEVNEGRAKDEIVATWRDGSTARVIQASLLEFNPDVKRLPPPSTSTGV